MTISVRLPITKTEPPNKKVKVMKVAKPLSRAERQEQQQVKSSSSPRLHAYSSPPASNDSPDPIASTKTLSKKAEKFVTIRQLASQEKTLVAEESKLRTQVGKLRESNQQASDYLKGGITSKMGIATLLLRVLDKEGDGKVIGDIKALELDSEKLFLFGKFMDEDMAREH